MRPTTPRTAPMSFFASIDVPSGTRRSTRARTTPAGVSVGLDEIDVVSRWRESRRRSSFHVSSSVHPRWTRSATSSSMNERRRGSPLCAQASNVNTATSSLWSSASASWTTVDFPLPYGPVSAMARPPPSSRMVPASERASRAWPPPNSSALAGASESRVGGIQAAGPTGGISGSVVAAPSPGRVRGASAMSFQVAVVTGN